MYQPIGILTGPRKNVSFIPTHKFRGYATVRISVVIDFELDQLPPLRDLAVDGQVIHLWVIFYSTKIEAQSKTQSFGVSLFHRPDPEEQTDAFILRDGEYCASFEGRQLLPTIKMSGWRKHNTPIISSPVH